MRSHLSFAPWGILLAAVLSTSPSVWLLADEPPVPVARASEKVTISGVLEAVTSYEIVADTEYLGPFKVRRVLDHGSAVTAGQNLVWFESEAIDKKITEAETAVAVARLALEADEFAHQHALKIEEIGRRKAERARKEAQQAFDNFVAVDRERLLKSAEFDRISARASFENATEELEQLEQMYKEDDLTEESEEIVLKRAKQAVDAAQFRLEGVEMASARAVTQGLAKAEADQQETLALAELAFEKAMQELDAKRKQREVELRKKQDAFHEEEKKLAMMKEERKRLVLTSPVDGIVLHGPLARGRLGDKPSLLKAGSAVAADQVVMTVVTPERLQIRGDLDEKQRAVVLARDTCTVKVDAFPDYQAAGKVVEVSLVPYAGMKYDCVVSLQGMHHDPRLKPLMTCRMEFVMGPATQEAAKEDVANEKRTTQQAVENSTEETK